MKQPWRYVVAQLQEDRQRCLLKPQQARKNLIEIRDMIDALLTTDSDAVRTSTVNKLRTRLVRGYSRIENLAVWSKIANEETISSNIWDCDCGVEAVGYSCSECGRPRSLDYDSPSRRTK